MRLRTEPGRAWVVVVLLAIILPAAAVSGGELLGSEVWTSMLMRIDRDTAAWSPIGYMNAMINGLAYDRYHDMLYGISAETDNIYRIDRQTAVATPIGIPGALGVDNANGLAYDPIDNILYATDNNTNTLLTVDTQTGVGTVIATISGGFTEIEGLGYDSRTRTLYGLTQLQRRIVQIDVRTGLATSVSGELPSLVWRGLDFDEERNVLFAAAVKIFGNAPLYSFDPTTTELRFIGEMQGAEAVQGLAYVPEPSTMLLALLALGLWRPRR